MLHFFCGRCGIVTLRILSCDVNTAEDVKNLQEKTLQNIRSSTK